MRQEERMSRQNSVMFIACIARVRYLVIGAIGELIILNKHNNHLCRTGQQQCVMSDINDVMSIIMQM